MKMDFPIEIFKKDEKTFIASCPTLALISSGPTLEKAISRLYEIINFYFTSSSELGMTFEDLYFSSNSSFSKTKDFRNLN